MPADSAKSHHPLVPHPSSQSGAAHPLENLTVSIERPAHDQLVLTYRLTGDVASLRLPEPRPPVRSDGLWRHSCFEVFIGHGTAKDYWEYNLSPSSAWAAYHFTAYREGMAPLLKGAPPMISQTTGSDSFELVAVLDLSWLAKSSAGAGLRLGLAAVIEDKTRLLSYWALKHSAEKPDFHHADSFVVVLD
jgi:hypothetical protein